MKVRVERYTLVIVPENEQDLAYIEDTMGLTADCQMIQLERIDGEDGVRLETELSSSPSSPPLASKDVPTKKIDASKFKDWGEGDYIERTTSRNGGETLVDIQAIDI